MKEARDEMIKMLENKYELMTSKIGAYLGFGIMQAGGGNS